MNNDGIKNEMEIIDTINHKQFCDLPVFWKNLLSKVFGKFPDYYYISAFKPKKDDKVDMYVIVNHKQRSFSIKSGDRISVHRESVSRFCGFLEWLGIEKEYTDFLKLYHYGDGTTDGTGEYHLSYKEIIVKYKNEINWFNERVNDPKVVKRIIMRFLSMGTPRQNSFVYYIYYGNKDEGICTRVQYILEYIEKNIVEYNHLPAIHFGPFIYEPAYRGLEDFDPNDKRRYYIVIKWPYAYDYIKRVIKVYQSYPF